MDSVHSLRRRWLAPSPPLAVDDEPHWRPAADPADAGEAQDDAEEPALAPQAIPVRFARE